MSGREDVHVYVIEVESTVRPGTWEPVPGASVSTHLDDTPYTLDDWRKAYPGRKYRAQRYTRGTGGRA